MIAILAAIELACRQQAFRAAPTRSLSVWADDEVTLSPTEGGGAGKWRTSRMPFLREPMDVASDRTTQEIVVIKPAQYGFTVGLGTLLPLYCMDQDPTTVMMVQPAEGLARAWSVARFTPNMLATPATAGILGESGDGGARYSGNTQYFKAFPGGYIIVAWSSSDKQMRSRPARVIIVDEFDACEATKEGDPGKRAERAATSFGDRKKVIYISTPTLKGLSRIEKKWLVSDQRRYHASCPHCHELQVTRWENVQWNKDEQDITLAAATARYVCESCGALWDQSDCMRAIDEANGATYVATFPGRRIVGFHPGILTPFVPIAQMVQEWLEAQGDHEKLMVFYNLRLGETWEDRGDEAAVGGLLARPRLPDGVVPNGVGMLTCMVDVQGDRAEALVMGHGGATGDEMYPILHQVIDGEWENDRVRKELDVIRARKWSHESGGSLRIRVTLVDVGYLESEVLRYTKTRESARVYGLRGKGRKRPLAPMVSRRPSINNSEQARVWEANTDKTKDVIFRRLRVQEPGPGYIHTPAWADEEYVEQLANSERKVPKPQPDGTVKVKWVKIRKRNEILDLFGGNLVATQRHICGMTREQVARRGVVLVERGRALRAEAALAVPAAVAEEVANAAEPVARKRKSRIRPARRGDFDS